MLTRAELFKSKFHLKRYALHKAHFENNIYNGEEYTLLSEYEKDKERLGGIDAVQIFDWAYTEEGGRVGSYMPWEELRNTEALAGQLAELRRRGTVSLCYVDAYFSRKGSPLAEVFGEAMTVKDKSGEPYYQLGEDHWVICPYNGEWRSFLSRAVCEAHARLGFDGVYVDQVGYGTHYTCYDKSHRHPLPSLQNAGERMLVEEISLAVGLPAAVEYFPADELLDTCCAALTDNDNYTVISRFVHPEIKQFKVISCDEPIGDNISAVERAFFNGLGLWLDGDSASDRWYSPRVRRTVEKHYKIMKDYAEAFESDNVIPLIGTLCESLISHMFRGEDKAVFTVFNRGASDFDGAAIPIGEFALGGYGFFDIYNGGGEIFPVMTEVGPALPIRLPRGSVGAIGAVKRK